MAGRDRSALLVVDHDVMRVVAEELAGEKLDDDDPPPGGLMELTRKPDGTWFRGRRTSNPEGLDTAIFAS